MANAPRTPTIKFHAPLLSPTHVPRPGIAALLDSSRHTKLVLIRAPAGYGKTTSMVQYRDDLVARGLQTGWMTLDAADNDETRFVDCLSRSVHALDDDGDPASRLANDGTALPIMDWLSVREEPFALFLDDFEAIHAGSVLSIVRELVDHLPNGSQLVIGSRNLPDLQLGRLRARGLLVEIEAEQLRFSRAEIDRFFGRWQDLHLSDADVSLLHRKTEGWISVIWLASIALRRSASSSEFIARFSGSDESISAYLAEDIFNTLSEPVRAFLMRTSLLRSFNASLCDAVLMRTDSEAMLDRLATDNLFLTSIGDEDRSFRYHSLFATFLRERLARDADCDVVALHRAASRWYELNDRPVPAIDHAIDGGATDRAIELLLHHAESFLAQGRMRLLARWLDALPDATLVRHPLMAVIKAWASLFTRGPDAAKRCLDRMGTDGDGDMDVAAYRNAIRPIVFSMMDRYEEAYEVGIDSLKTLPSTKPFADSALTNAMAIVLSVMDKRGEALALLDASRDRRGIEQSHFNRMYSETVEGIIDLQDGRIRQAAARFAIAVDATHATSNTHAKGNAWAGVLFAGSVYERGEMQQAEHLLRIYVPLARDAGLPDHMISGHAMLSRIAFERGDVDLSFQRLNELEHFGYERHLARVVASAKLERAYLLLRQGNASAAREMLDRADDRLVWERARRLRLVAHDVDNWEVADLRWHVHFAPNDDLLSSLCVKIAHATGQGRHRRALKLKILHAQALRYGGAAHGAIVAMTDVLKVACAEGCRRFILDEGEGAAALVLEVANERASMSSARDPLFDAYLAELVRTIGPSTVAASDAASKPKRVPSGLVESLTQKETRILALLAEGYSNQAMSEKLFVSDSTVRTHLRSINAKLQVRSRAQAVVVARRIGLVD